MAGSRVRRAICGLGEGRIVAESVPPGELSSVRLELIQEASKCTSAVDARSEPIDERWIVNSRNAPRHVGVLRARTCPDDRHEPRLVVGIEVVESLIELDQLSRPDNTAREIEEGLAAGLLVNGLAQFVVFDSDSNNLG